MPKITGSAVVALAVLSLTAPVAASSASAAPAVASLAPRTDRDLTDAMYAEAFASGKYTLYAEQADRERRYAAAQLFRAGAAQERFQHVGKVAALVGLVGSDEDNLRDAITGEDYEATKMYPAYAQDAARRGERKAAELFTEISQDEARHRDVFRQALTALRNPAQVRVPSALPVSPITVQAGPAGVRSKTRADLLAGMRGEAFASVKYYLYADQARANGRKTLADLFTSAARIEFREHMSAQAQLAGVVQDTATNLNAAVGVEHREATVTYPRMAQRAAAAGDAAAAGLFREIAQGDAKTRDALLAEAKK